MTYGRQKTRGHRRDRAEMRIRVEPRAVGLMRKYADPDGVRLFDVYRRLSCESGGAGVDMYTVHAALDHSGGRMAITETYVVRDWRPIWDANRAVLDLFDWSSLQLNELW